MRCGDSKILLDYIFVKCCQKPHRSLTFSALCGCTTGESYNVPAFDILFVLNIARRQSEVR